MSNPEDRPGGYVPWSTNQAVTSEDLTNTGKMAEQSLWNGFVANLLRDFATGQPQSGFVGDGCKPAVVGDGSGRQVTIAPGFALFLEDGDDEFGVDYVPIHVADAQAITLDEATLGNTRTDIVCLKPALVDSKHATRRVYDAQTQAFEVDSLPTLRRRSFEIVVVKGVENVGAPDTPAGAIPVAECTIDHSGSVLEVFVHDIRTTLGIQAPWLGPDAVGNESLIDGAVTSSKLDDGAVTSSKLDDGAVTSSKLGYEAVTNAKLGTGAVRAFNISDGHVTEAKLATGAVTNTKIASNAVSQMHMDIKFVLPEVTVGPQTSNYRIVTIHTKDLALTTLAGVQRYALRVYRTDMVMDSSLWKFGTVTNGNLVTLPGHAACIVESSSFGQISIRLEKAGSGAGGSCYLEVTPIITGMSGKPAPGVVIVEEVTFS